VLGVTLEGRRELVQTVVSTRTRQFAYVTGARVRLVGVRGDQARRASIQEPFACAIAKRPRAARERKSEKMLRCEATMRASSMSN